MNVNLNLFYLTWSTVLFSEDLLLLLLVGVGLSPLGTEATSGLLYKPQMIDEGDCGAKIIALLVSDLVLLQLVYHQL
jgi:hypothetical protein